MHAYSIPISSVYVVVSLFYCEDMIYENSAITNTFVSVPSDMSTFNGASYLGGIIKGVLDSASFTCKVTAHTISAEEQPPPAANTPGGVPTLALDKTVFLIKFAPEVMARERQFS
jgi:trafficking protein particle complex subunit 5